MKKLRRKQGFVNGLEELDFDITIVTIECVAFEHMSNAQVLRSLRFSLVCQKCRLHLDHEHCACFAYRNMLKHWESVL